MASRARRLRLLRELARALRPGGRALLTVWASKQEDARKLAKCGQAVIPLTLCLAPMYLHFLSGEYCVRVLATCRRTEVPG